MNIVISRRNDISDDKKYLKIEAYKLIASKYSIDKSIPVLFPFK